MSYDGDGDHVSVIAISAVIIYISPDRCFGKGLILLGNSPSLTHHSWSGMLEVSPTQPLKAAGHTIAGKWYWYKT